MVAFSFETAGEDVEETPDILSMINGGEKVEKPAAEFTPPQGEFPVFGSIDSDDDEVVENDPEIDGEHQEDELDETDLREQIKTLEEEYVASSLMRQRVEQELKDIKEAEKGMLKQLQRLKDQLAESLRDPPRQTSQVDGFTASETVPFEPNQSTSTADPAWWKIPADRILDKVPGIGPKKRDALLAVFTTLKEMEDLRGDASRQFKHFADVLPDGIGKGLADEIENAMLESIR